MGDAIYPGTPSICYWGHTTDPAHIRLCRDGKNYVCPQCCHERCKTTYPGLYGTCAAADWPVWPPAAAHGRVPLPVVPGGPVDREGGLRRAKLRLEIAVVVISLIGGLVALLAKVR